MELVDAAVLLVAGLLAVLVAHILRQLVVNGGLSGAFRSSTSSSKQVKLPPGPPGWPVAGHLHIFAAAQPHQELEKLAGEYGPVMLLRLGSRLTVIVSSADMARQVLKEQDDNLASRPYLAAFDNLSFWEGTCGFAPYGARHQLIRKLMMTELFSVKRIQQNEEKRRQEVSAGIKSILDESSAASEDGVPGEVDIHVKSTQVIMNNMTQLLMSKRFCTLEASSANNGGHKSKLQDEEAEEFMRLIGEGNRLLGIPVIGDNIPYLAFLDTLQKRRMRKLRASWDKFFNNIIDEHRQKAREGASGRDLVDVMLSLPDEPGISKDNTIKGTLVDSLLAGVDSSTVAVEWAMAEFLKNPHTLRKAHAELDSVLGKDRQVQESDLPSLPYIQAALKETLRLHPVGPLMIPHYSRSACKVGGYDIPADTLVITNVWTIQRNPEVWEQPLQFRPDRFVGRDIDIKGHHSFDMLPFGSGRRGCPGSTLGFTTANFIVARLLHSFDWSLPHGQRPEDLDMSGTFGLVLPRTHHLKAVPTPRLPPHLY